MRRYNLQSWKRRNNRIFETNYSRICGKQPLKNFT